MTKRILVTGVKGFIGSNACKYYKGKGYTTYGIGHGGLSVVESNAMGLDYWIRSDISIDAIKEFQVQFDLILHCGGSGSVGFSVEHPYEDFKKTVDGTLEVLEYIRLFNSNAHLIYPSSPAVQGEHPDFPMKESYLGKPASPYGFHKKIAEELCESYSIKFDLKISILRLFSVYGNGLRKQLLWDAYHKMITGDKEVCFWGTGKETRDFVHINDVLRLIDKLLLVKDKFLIINGGTGVKYSIDEVISLMIQLMQSTCKAKFNNEINVGNPIYYWACISKAEKLGWSAEISFKDGLQDFLNWIEYCED